ncbi:MFS transporter [Microbacterium sp. Se5.02b]|uniref:MFS transporter n=1 Tax=Microbacterium sp. Se5.02b TaxID=2864103 RepID=UPI001C69344C|nr:MFS transporter [Microbacterium sp. Se5.02b]QYM63960.1 MFS transporter [Microbacterium sp. Se5.02b]
MGRRRGAGKHVVVLGATFTLVGITGQALAGAEWQVLVSRVVMGAGEAAVFSGALPWVWRQFPPHRRGSASGLFGLSMWSGLALGPLVASVANLAGERAAWLLLAALGTGSLGFVLGCPSSGPVRLPPLRLRTLRVRGAAAPSLMFGLAAYGYGTLSAVLVLYLDSGPGGSVLGLPIFAGTFLLIRIAGSRVVDRVGGRTVAAASLIVEALGFVVIVGTDSAAGALIGVALVGGGCSLAFPAAVSVAISRSPRHAAGTAVAGMTSFWDLGILTAGVGGGLLAMTFGHRAAFVGALVAAIVGLVVALSPVRDGTPQSDARGSKDA